jgi:hypothetical protein
MRFPLTIAGLLAVAGSLTVSEAAGADAAAQAKPALSWHQSKDDTFTLMHQQQPMLRFHASDELTKPFFHPVRPMGGPVVTEARPKDHRWHYGLWFAWKLINGVNYWEEGQAAGQPAGQTNWRSFQLTTDPAGQATLEGKLTYRPGDGTPVLIETRRIVIHPPKQNGRYAIDWHATFTARQKVTLDRTPPPGVEGGKSWGGYAGLSVRLNNALTDRRIITPDGPLSLKGGRSRVRRIAMDYSGEVEGEAVGMAMLEHPANPRFPTPWYAIAGEPMSFFNAAVLNDRPMTLEAGEQWTLRYRLVVHNGRWSPATLRAAYRRYVQDQTPEGN